MPRGKGRKEGGGRCIWSLSRQLGHGERQTHVMLSGLVPIGIGYGGSLAREGGSSEVCRVCFVYLWRSLHGARSTEVLV
jgi:hypothetical protein